MKNQKKQRSLIASKLPDSLIIDRNPNSAAKLESDGFKVLNADVSKPEILAEFDLSSRLILADDDFGFEIFALVDEEKCNLYEVEGVNKVCNSVQSLISAFFGKTRYFEIPVDEMSGLTLKEYDAGRRVHGGFCFS